MASMPHKLNIKGRPHTLCVFQVETRFPNGTPRKVTRIAEEGTVHLQGGEEFITAYVPSENLEENGSGDPNAV